MNSIEVNGIRKNFGPASIEDVSFSLPEGKKLAIIGEVGSGKATLAKIIAGAAAAESGTVRLFDHRQDEKAVRERIGYVFEGFPFSGALTIGDIDRIFSSLYEKWSSKTFMSHCFSFSIPRKKAVRELSPLSRRRLFLSVALSHAARLLILNDAFSDIEGGLDEDTAAAVKRFLSRNEKRSLLITTSSFGEVKDFCDHFLFLEKGKMTHFISKQQLKDELFLVTCSAQAYRGVDQTAVILREETEFECRFLIKKEHLPAGMQGVTPQIEDFEKLYRKAGTV